MAMTEEQLGKAMLELARAEGHAPAAPDRSGAQTTPGHVRLRRSIVADMHANGASNREIAEAIGAKKSTIESDIHNLGLRANREPRRVSEKTARLRAEISKYPDLSSSAVARIVGCHSTTVLDHRKKSGNRMIDGYRTPEWPDNA